MFSVRIDYTEKQFLLIAVGIKRRVPSKYADYGKTDIIDLECQAACVPAIKDRLAFSISDSPMSVIGCRLNRSMQHMH